MDEQKIESVIEAAAPKNVPSREAIILAAPRRTFEGFFEFMRERGVAGLAIGFVLGTSVQKVVTSFVDSIVNPAIGLLTDSEGFSQIAIGPFRIGMFMTALIDFLFLVFIVYLVYKVLRLEVLDKPKT